MRLATSFSPDCCFVAVGLLLACSFSAENSRKTATKEQASKKLDRTWYRSNRSFYGQKDHLEIYLSPNLAFPSIDSRGNSIAVIPAII